MKVIYLSPARQPENKYAGVDTNEQEQMQALARAIQYKLHNNYTGVTCYIANENTPVRDPHPSSPEGYGQRIYEAQQVGADMYLALHSNAGGATSQGPVACDCINPSMTVADRAFSDLFLRKMKAITPGSDPSSRYFRYKDIGYPEQQQAISAGFLTGYLEVEFHYPNPELALWIINNRWGIAQVIVDCIEQTYGLVKKPAAKQYEVNVVYKTNTSIQGYSGPNNTMPLGPVKKSGATLYAIQRYDVGEKSFVKDHDTEAWYLLKDGTTFNILEGWMATLTEPGQYYRVRKTWNDAASQIAAYVNFLSARSHARTYTGYNLYAPDGTLLDITWEGK